MVISRRLGVSIAVLALVALVAVGALVAFQRPPDYGTKVKDPTIGTGGAVVTYPNSYAQLSGYVLDTMNEERAAAGSPPLTLSPAVSAQQHADSMLYFGYFSHWDTQGLKPYMRYSLLNGTSAVFENVAWSHSPTIEFVDISSAESAMEKLNFEMMYDDSIYQWGHRDAILSPFHSRVSIGIAYNGTDLYLVEDFENSYGNLSVSYQDSGSSVTLSGALDPGVSPSSIAVYYDPPPVVLSPFKLMTNLTLAGSYDIGSYVGSVLPRCDQYCSGSPGNVTNAQVWNSTGPTYIQFSLQDLPGSAAPGVYTLYLQNLTGTIFTSLSVFVGPYG
ncbi:MAG TPA: CAP domain-containing protein [Conexivisphaerales archaeon]|nr:CAP domain-containing protein [Conexivisphaerales archaeon]